MKLHSKRMSDGSKSSDLFHQAKGLMIRKREEKASVEVDARGTRRRDTTRLTSAVNIKSLFLSNESIALTTSEIVSTNARKFASIGAAGGRVGRLVGEPSSVVEERDC